MSTLAPRIEHDALPGQFWSRASNGAPVQRPKAGSDLIEIERLKQVIVGTSLQAGLDYQQPDYAPPTFILVGNEQGVYNAAAAD